MHGKPDTYRHVRERFLTKAHLAIVALIPTVGKACISTSSDVMAAFLEIQERKVTVMCNLMYFLVVKTCSSCWCYVSTTLGPISRSTPYLYQSSRGSDCRRNV